jgi:uncharacterized alpha-E superfamily protein
MTYRRRYFSKPDWSGVAELLFSDENNPRSVGFQTNVLLGESANFPGDHDFGLMPEILKRVAELSGLVETEDLPNAEILKEIGLKLETLSDKLTQHYFSHSVRRVY